jgi:DNA-binding NarL/FixJ family response regulator
MQTASATAPRASGSPAADVSVVIVDDHPLVREGLERVIAGDPRFRVAGMADSIEGALAIDAAHVDVVTLDLSLPGVGGLEGIQRIRHKWPDARVLVLTVHPESTHAAACAQHGAAGFLGKSASPTEIRTAVSALAAGGQYFSATALEAIVSHPHEIRLSPRESEVLRRLAAGQRITDIAEEMGVSIKTASTHKMRLQRKLGASNTAQIIVLARNRGLLS